MYEIYETTGPVPKEPKTWRVAHVNENKTNENADVRDLTKRDGSGPERTEDVARGARDGNLAQSGRLLTKDQMNEN